MSRASSLSSEFGHTEVGFSEFIWAGNKSMDIFQDLIVTPFAQILASLRTVRSNYVHLTNLPTRSENIKPEPKMVFIFLNLLLSKGTEMNELLQESPKNIRSPTAAFIKRVFQVKLGIISFMSLSNYWKNCPSIDQTNLFYLELTKCSMFTKAWDFKINLSNFSKH